MTKAEIIREFHKPCPLGDRSECCKQCNEFWPCRSIQAIEELGTQLAQAGAERDRLRERLAAVQKEVIEWLCEPCKTVHPSTTKLTVLQPCPVCSSAMVPSSFNLREIQRVRATLADRDAEWMKGLGLSMMSHRDPGQAREDIERPLQARLAEVVALLTESKKWAYWTMNAVGFHEYAARVDKALAKGRGA